VGFDSNGSSKFARLSGDGGIAALPILQYDFEEVRSVLEAGVEAVGEWSGPSPLVLPVDELYRCALLSGSAHWIGSAVRWMIDAPPVELTSTELLTAAVVPALDQTAAI